MTVTGRPFRNPRVVLPRPWGCVASPCNWVRPDDVPCPACGTAATTALLDAMFAAAADWLFDATCHRFPGTCPVVMRPCPTTCACDCACSHGCGDVRRLDMRNHWCYPAVKDDTGTWRVSIVENGVPWVYGVDFWMSDGWTIHTCRPWPAVQNLCAPPATTGTWEIVAAIGVEPPPLLLRAAADLACELVKQATTGDSCLPDGVRSISRRGVSMDVESEQITFDGERTGVATVDMAVDMWACRNADVWATFAAVRGPLEFTGYDGPYPVAV